MSILPEGPIEVGDPKEAWEVQQERFRNGNYGGIEFYLPDYPKEENHG